MKTVCTVNTLSLLLISDNSFIEVPRCLFSMELFLNTDYHGKYFCFDLPFNSLKSKIWSLYYLFCLSLMSATLDHLSNDNIGAVKNEAILKLVYAIFYRIFIFSLNDSPSKLSKMFFYFI